MSRLPHDEQALIHYLLGQGSDPERAAIEQRYFADPAYLEALEITEEDLIENYWRGRLSNQEREWFEKFYLNSPARRRKAEISTAFLSVMDKPSEKRVFWAAAFQRRWLFAALAIPILVLLPGWWLYIRWSAPHIVSALLVSQTRSATGRANSIIVPQSAAIIRLRCDVLIEGASGSSRAILEDADERSLLAGEVKVLREFSGHALIQVELPAHHITPGDYILRIEPTAPDPSPRASTSYSLRIVRP